MPPYKIDRGEDDEMDDDVALFLNLICALRLFDWATLTRTVMGKKD
jgi:hypothetical protein